jgi:hypothetical protein
MKNFVAAKGLNCNCLFCRQCLVDREILFATDSVISQKQAKTDGLRCSGCGCMLSLQKENSAVSRNNKTHSEEKSQKQPK